MRWERVACLLTEGLKADGGPYDGDVANAVPLYLKWLNAGPPNVGSQTRHALELVRSGMGPAKAGRMVWEQSGRRAAGNGSLMRTAPIGVLLAGEPGRLQEASLRDSAVTHFDPRCQLACAAFNAAIAAAVMAPRDADREEMVREAQRALDSAALKLRIRNADLEDIVETSRRALMEDVQDANHDDPALDGPELEISGRKAGFVRVAFRLAFWELFHAPTFEAALIDVVNRGGDSDTNGAIAGALLGARFGVMGIPSRWRHAVLDAPPEERLGEMAEACHPARLFGSHTLGSSSACARTRWRTSGSSTPRTA
jgi:ADP-ribosyl-[dinitrogen reductase] hydrolase